MSFDFGLNDSVWQTWGCQPFHTSTSFRRITDLGHLQISAGVKLNFWPDSGYLHTPCPTAHWKTPFIFERNPRYNTERIIICHMTRSLDIQLLHSLGHSRFWTVAAAAVQTEANNSGLHKGPLHFMIIVAFVHHLSWAKSLLSSPALQHTKSTQNATDEKIPSYSAQSGLVEAARSGPPQVISPRQIAGGESTANLWRASVFLKIKVWSSLTYNTAPNIN